MLAFSQAHAREDPVRQVAEIAGLHCQLWLHQLKNKQSPIQPDEYKHILGKELDSDQQEYLHAATQGGLPDFGLILGARWEVASFSDRQNFNQYFLRWLRHRFSFDASITGHYCNLDISITLREQTEDTDALVELPQPRLLQAAVYTLLPGNPNAIPLTYYLQQELTGWNLVEITLGKTLLVRENAQNFSRLIAQGGFAHLTSWLINQSTPQAAPNKVSPAASD